MIPKKKVKVKNDDQDKNFFAPELKSLVKNTDKTILGVWCNGSFDPGFSVKVLFHHLNDFND